MPHLFRSVLGKAICFALILSVGPQLGFSQTDETSASAPASTATVSIDTSFLYNGESPKSLEQLRYMEQHFAKIADRVKAATVNITMGGSQGSGVVVTSDGYILTAAHVISGPNREAKVTFIDPVSAEEKSFDAETLGVESGIDSGMLKIKPTDDDDEFPYLDIAISEELKEGQWVMAVGHPGGIDTARGMVVRIGRIIMVNSRVIRTDCTLVGGDSGGPLIDMHGDVIGIHSRIGSQLDENLHVPADTYAENWDKLAKGIVIDGSPSLGFGVVDDTNEVESVNKSGPSEIAGLEKGDIIIKVGSVKVEDREEIFNAIRAQGLKPNMKARLVVRRGDEEITIKLTVGDKNRPIPPKREEE